MIWRLSTKAKPPAQRPPGLPVVRGLVGIGSHPDIRLINGQLAMVARGMHAIGRVARQFNSKSLFDISNTPSEHPSVVQRANLIAP